MAGEYDYGEDDYGDPPAELAASAVPPKLSALFFDPATRRHVLNGDGSFAQIHPVDAKFINAINVAREKFPSVKDTGAAFWKLGSPYDPRAQRKCEDWAKQATKEIVAAGDASLDGVVFEPHGPNGAFIEVSYTNLRLLPRVSKSVSISV